MGGMGEDAWWSWVGASARMRGEIAWDWARAGARIGLEC